MIASTTVNAIKNQLDIVDIVSNYVELKKSGANFKANCPFHGEKTASMVVSPSKQIFHCFGCKVGGDAIAFVQQYERLNYPEALEKIADLIGVEVEYDASANSNAKECKRVMEQVSVWYQKNLDDTHREYLYSRGVSEETIRTWGIGYAPRNPKTQQFLESNFLPLNIAIESGIMAQSESRTYARFSERIMFPIKSHTGQIIGFAGRTLKESANIGKYINSPETKLFDKSSILFGFDRAKETIFKTKRAVLHEGQLDITLTHQHGFTDTTATQGTALTEKHLPQLKKAKAKVILAYDGDGAGQESALKGAILLSAREFDGGVVLFPDGLDPADMMKDGKQEEYKHLIDNATPLIEFVLNSIIAKHNTENPHEKNSAVGECLDYLRVLTPIIANEYIGYIGSKLNIDTKFISLTSSTPAHPTKKVTHETPMVLSSSIEESLLLTIYEHPNRAEWTNAICPAHAWHNRDLFVALVTHKVTKGQMSSILANEEIKPIVEKEAYIAFVKNKQKKYLQNIRANSTDINEILFLNRELKKVM